MKKPTKKKPSKKLPMKAKSKAVSKSQPKALNAAAGKAKK